MSSRTLQLFSCLVLGGLFVLSGPGCDREPETTAPPVVDDVVVEPDLEPQPAVADPASDGIDNDSDGVIDEPDETIIE